MRLVPSYVLPPATELAIAALRPWRTLDFDAHRWRGLRDAVAQQLGVKPCELSTLHGLGGDATPRKNRRRTTGRRSNVEALELLVRTYEDFICEVVAPHVASEWGGSCDEVVFQAVPSLRVSPPDVKPSGQRHRDGAYGHQPGMINWWLPLTPAYGTNTLWLEDSSTTSADAESDAHAGRRRLQKRAQPLEGSFGTLHRFHGHARFHFTRPNDTPHTRVSLDMRVVPGPAYDDDWPGSRHAATGRQAFFLGGYYAACARDPGTGEWRVRREIKGGFLRGNAARRLS